MPTRLILAAASLLTAAAANATQFDEIDRRAQALAAAPYQPQDKTVPAEAKAIDYTAYQGIRFNREKAIWPPAQSGKKNTPFHLEFFYRAFIFPERVDIHLIDRQGRITPVPFDPAMFTMSEGSDKALPTQLPADYSFSGLKVYYDFGKPRTREEAIIFQGASYFRIPSPGQYFGLSARGLAVNTAHPGLGEEFPAFKAFWVQEPAPGSKQITIYALLDGPTVTGAYEFLVQPKSSTTIVDVKATLHYRATPGRVGYAPLTSMFWFGENNYREFSDYRYQVHDSDGLLIHEHDGTRLWRPLQTVTRDLVDYFTSKETPRAFGLLQRDREFGHHNDIEAHYHQRPTLWVEPGKQWPKGSIVLWQIPTTDEYHDNIVAYWMPEKNPTAGETHTITYRLLTTLEEPPGLPGSGQVIGTYMIPSYGRMDRFLIMVDFAWPGKKQPGEEPPKIEVTAGGAEILAQYVKPNPDAQAWRAHMVIQFPSEDMNNLLTCRLTDEKGQSTEKWTYTFVPQGKID